MTAEIERQVRKHLTAFEDGLAAVSEFGTEVGPFDLRRPVTEVERETALALTSF